MPSVTPGLIREQKHQLGSLPTCQEQERLLSCLGGHPSYSTGDVPRKSTHLMARMTNGRVCQGFAFLFFWYL